MLIKISISCLLLCAPAAGKTQDSTRNTPLSAAKAWWQATTVGDTAYLKNHSTGGLTVTFNNGRSFTRAEIIAQVATHNPSARIGLEWFESVAQMPASQTAIVSSRVIETAGTMLHHYRFLTVLVRADSNWLVAAAQSTRVLELTPPIALPYKNALATYAGHYRTPAGAVLKLVPRDSSLVLIEPSGTETGLVPVAPDLFELPQVLSAGLVRFAFSRDDTGAITHLTRIAHRITPMPRVR